MPTRDEKDRQEHISYNGKHTMQNHNSFRTIAYEDQEFEMISFPDGGEGNKAALDNLSKATK
ncbi:MAG: hypothetical protein Q8936_09810 [Bacillota bacterium]|nr:hypothetical protein [Bacillota bacterium]